MNILFSSKIERGAVWIPLLKRLLPEDQFFEWPDINGGDIDIAIVGTHAPGTFTGLSKLRLVQSLWMGVDTLVAEKDLPANVPVARLADPGMVDAMTETAIAFVLDWHRHFYSYRMFQGQRVWKRMPQFRASDRTVGILGLGELGRSAASRLASLGFNVSGLSRRPKKLAGIHCSTDLDEVLGMSDAVICMLPLTDKTRGILDKRALSLIKPGGCLINVARGPHVVIADLVDLLDSGHLAHAYLDVIVPEPLPSDSPLWGHPGLTLTPHIAAVIDPRTSAKKVAENVNRARHGEPPLNRVDIGLGY